MKSKSNYTPIKDKPNDYPDLDLSTEVLRHYELLGLTEPSFYAFTAYMHNKQQMAPTERMHIRVTSEYIDTYVKGDYASQTGRTTNKIIQAIVYARKGYQVKLEIFTNREVSRVKMLIEAFLRHISSKEQLSYAKNNHRIVFNNGEEEGAISFSACHYEDNDQRSNTKTLPVLDQSTKEKYYTLVV